MRDANARAELRSVLIERWFPEKALSLNLAVAAHSEEDAYELTLREGTPPPYMVTPRVGQAAFRNVVLQAYDYRCAATGWRLIVPGAWGLIDAAHLIPYAETQNNDPRNGMALTPTFHRALDQNLIAPGPDLKWHVSRVVEPTDSGQSADCRTGWAGRDLLRGSEVSAVADESGMAHGESTKRINRRYQQSFRVTAETRTRLSGTETRGPGRRRLATSVLLLSV